MFSPVVPHTVCAQMSLKGSYSTILIRYTVVPACFTYALTQWLSTYLDKLISVLVIVPLPFVMLGETTSFGDKIGPHFTGQVEHSGEDQQQLED